MQVQVLLPSISKLEYLCHNQSSSCDVAFSQKRAYICKSVRTGQAKTVNEVIAFPLEKSYE
jgi:hypothetical protein